MISDGGCAFLRDSCGLFCNAVEDGEDLLLYDGNQGYPEDAVRLGYSDEFGLLTVSEEHRGNRVIRFASNEENIVCMVAAVLAKRMFDNHNLDMKRDFARKLITSEDYAGVSKLLLELPKDVLAFGYRDSAKVSLVLQDLKMSVYFHGVPIVESAITNRGYLVFYVSCLRLAEVRRWVSGINCSSYTDSLPMSVIEELFLFGRVF